MFQKNFHFSFVILILTIIFIIFPEGHADETDSNFEWNFVKAAISTTNGNLIVSPYSAKIILALFKESLEYNSIENKELLNAIPEFKQRFEAGKRFEKILKSFYERSKYGEIEIDTRILSQMGNVLDEAFTIIAHERYNVQSKYINITSKDLILILANSLQFKSAWMEGFTSTFSGPWFPRVSGRENYNYQVQYIENDNMNLFYYKSYKLNVEIYSLPYKTPNITMTIIYPMRGALEDVLQKINGETLRNLKKSLKLKKKQLVLPKFKFSSDVDLQKILGKLNIKNLFSKDVDFQTLGSDNIKTGYFNQTSTIIFDDKGSGAKVNTYITMVDKNYISRVAIREDPFAKFMNRPFLYLIEDVSCGTILFAGKVAFPNPSHSLQEKNTSKLKFF